MRHLAFSLAATFSLAVLFAAPLGAQTSAGQSGQGMPQPPAQAASGTASPQPQTASMPTPRDGRAFGQHVSGMAPEHPLDHGGAMFGDCVSDLAVTGECAHHDDHEDE